LYFGKRNHVEHFCTMGKFNFFGVDIFRNFNFFGVDIFRNFNFFGVDIFRKCNFLM